MLYKNLLAQLVFIIPVFLFFLFIHTCIIPCNSVAYGMGISLLNESIVVGTTILSMRFVQKNTRQGIGLAFLSAGIRFMMIGVLFAIGIKALNLTAVTMVFSFIMLHLIGQLTGFIFALRK